MCVDMYVHEFDILLLYTCSTNYINVIIPVRKLKLCTILVNLLGVIGLKLC